MVTWSKSAVETGNFAEDRQSDAIISAPSLMYPWPVAGFTSWHAMQVTIARFIGPHFLGGPALHVLARVRAAIKKCRHRNTTNRFKFARIELYQKGPNTCKRRTL